MIIPIEEVLKRKMVTNRDFADGEGLVEPEGAGIDIRLLEVWKMIPGKDAFLGKIKRKTQEYKKVAEFKPGQSDWFTLEPGKMYQFQSVEKMNVPEDTVMRFIARYNLLASGIMILGYKADPGFKGQYSVPLINLSGVPFRIELGARWGQCEFHRIDGKGVKYRGQWKHGRIYTKKEEVQV